MQCLDSVSTETVQDAAVAALPQSSNIGVEFDSEVQRQERRCSLQDLH